MTSASCTSLGMRVEFFDTRNRTALHRAIDRAGHQCGDAGTFGEQARVVPAVTQLLLGRAGRALHEQRRVAADRGGEVFAEPRLGGAGHTEQQQRTIGGQRGDCDLDEPTATDVLRRDHGAVGQLAAEHVGHDRPRRQLPARRALAIVDGGQRSQLVRELLLGVRPQDAGVGRACSYGLQFSEHVVTKVGQVGEREREADRRRRRIDLRECLGDRGQTRRRDACEQVDQHGAMRGSELSGGQSHRPSARATSAARR